jgi:hypothetical protein
MKKSIIRLTLFYITLISYPLNTIIEPTYSSIKKIKKELTKSNILSDEDYALVSENPNADFAYIPEAIKLSIAKLHRTYKELAAFIDLSLFLDEKIHVADSELIKRLMLELIALLQVSDLSALDPEDTTLHLMQKYMNDLDAGNLHIKTAFLDEFGNIDIEIGDGKRSYDLFNTYNGYAVTTGGVLNIYGDSSNIITQGSGNTITVSLSATGTVGKQSANLSSLGNGMVSSSSTGLLSSTPTINNAVQIGNTGGTLSSIGLASNGQVLLGATGAAPAFGTLTSNAGTITFTPGANSLNLDTTVAIPNSFPTNAGTATPSAGVLNISGGSNINTSTGANSSTVTINLNSSPSVTGSINAGGSITAGANISATGTISAGGAITSASNISATGTITAGNGLITSTGGLVVKGGGINSTGTTILNSLGGGVVTSSPTGVVSSGATTNNAVQIGNATGTLTSIGLASNGQVLLGATGAAPKFGTLTSNAGTITFTPGANSLNLETSGSTPNSFPTNAGTATPSAGVLNISGGSNINTSTGANSSTVTINLNSSPSVTGTMTAGNGLIATTGGLVVQGGGINSTGPTILNSLTGGVMLSSPTGVVSTTAASSNGQILLGATGGNAPFFTGLSSPANPSGATSMIYSSGPGFLALQSVPLFANVVRVDWLNGNDSTATVINGLPYKTISAALTATGAAASNVSPYVIWVMPGIYNETLTMQQYVSVIGMSNGAGLTPTSGGSIPTTVGVGGVVIQKLGVTTNTTLVTMAENSQLNNVSLNMTTATNGLTLNGISFSGTQSATARILNVNLNINSTATTGTVSGVISTSTGTPGPEITALYATVVSINTGCTAYGVNISSGSGYFNIDTSNISANTSSGSLACYGIINNSASTIVNLAYSTLSGTGTSSADLFNMSTNGSIVLTATRLINTTAATATTQNFTSTISPAIVSWGVNGTPGNGIKYLTPGTLPTASLLSAEAGTQIQIIQPCTIKSLRLTASAGPGSLQTALFTVRKNFTPTTLLAYITGTAITGADLIHAVSFTGGDWLSMQLTTSPTAAALTNPQAVVEMY